ncbi:MAG: ComEC/Rec2 family competence protein [Atopobiaceae bacterium]
MSAFELVVSNDPSISTHGYRCRARVVGEGTDAGDVWLVSNERLCVGDRVRCVGRFKRADLGDEWGRICRRQGVWGTVTSVRMQEVRHVGGIGGMVQGLRSRVSDSFGSWESEERAVLDGSVTGLKEPLDAKGTSDLFRTCGVSHLVAVSGGHLAVVASVCDAICLRLGLGPLPRIVTTLLCSGCFVAFCGAPVSAVRAWAMSVVSLLSVVAGRRSHALSSVCLVALGMAVADPTLSGQVGFLLSAGAVVGLCLYARYASYALGVLLPVPRVPRILGERFRRAAVGLWHCGQDALGATLVAQAVTAPILACSFAEVSLVSPLANLLLGPLFDLVVPLGVTAACLVGVPWAQGVVLRAADVACGAVLLVLRVLSRVPGACLSSPQLAWGCAVAGVVCLAALAVWWPLVRPRRVWGAAGIACLVLAAVLVRWRWFAPARICVLDVGQGDAILVQDGGSAVLVDAGVQGSVVQPLLRAHVLHLDAVVITHLHADHYGGVGDLVGSIPCSRVFVGPGVAANEPPQLSDDIRQLTGRDAEELRYHDRVQAGGFAMEAVAPTLDVTGLSNEDSLVMVARYEGPSGTLDALLTGDAEKDQLSGVLQRGDVGDIDLLKVGHHGSEVSLDEGEARCLDAEVSVASAGEGNSYGHPRQECVDALTSSGSWFLCTKDVGGVEVRPGREGPVVRTGL